MTNKIVQLEDKGGNNVFPIAGGMVADSITTAMIQDGAVTSDKLSFAVYTKAEIDSMIGTINTALDTINGEII